MQTENSNYYSRDIVLKDAAGQIAGQLSSSTQLVRRKKIMDDRQLAGQVMLQSSASTYISGVSSQEGSFQEGVHMMNVDGENCNITEQRFEKLAPYFSTELIRTCIQHTSREHDVFKVLSLLMKRN
eukprot:TRINITY_DN3486_c0_g1_i2.p3 TRINITY_DN3486_c0_g1~~TRINITY_DN3486_c0_g1_i2.p3  ORF type:complete len:126 (-),score=3.93 TRINITY_DN3486_c0_g1_i2:143-520(-)